MFLKVKVFLLLIIKHSNRERELAECMVEITISRESLTKDNIG